MDYRNHDHFREATKKVDYIDRNEAIEAIKNDALDLVYYGKKEAIECLESVPAADVALVRHGGWIEDERTYPGPGLANNLCSVCGEIAGSWKEGLEPGRKWAYCPNCGADMRGKSHATP